MSADEGVAVNIRTKSITVVRIGLSLLEGGRSRQRCSKAGENPLAPAVSFTPYGLWGCSFAATPICECQRAHSRSRKGRALPRWLQSIAWVGVGPCSTQHRSNIRSTAFIKREFTSKIGFARLSAEGSTIRR